MSTVAAPEMKKPFAPVIVPPDWLVADPPAARTIPLPLLTSPAMVPPPRLVSVPAAAKLMPVAAVPVSLTLPAFTKVQAVPAGPLMPTALATVPLICAVPARVVGTTDSVTPLA